MTKAIVFDIGNVVLTYKPLYDRLFQSWADLLHLSFEDFFKEYLKVYIDFETNNLKLEDWILKVDPNADPKDFYKKIEQILSDENQVKPYLINSTINLIKDLKSQKFIVGCLSNTEYFFYPFLNKFILPVFDFSILSWQVKDRKPSPLIYQNIFKYGQWKPNEVIFIDDHQENIDAATKLGINGILFQNFDQLGSQIKKFLPSLITV